MIGQGAFYIIVEKPQWRLRSSVDLFYASHNKQQDTVNVTDEVWILIAFRVYVTPSLFNTISNTV